jgi:DNA-binding NtrC family response regulator
MATNRILILDDDPPIAALYGAALESAGHPVVVCTSYEDARAFLKQEIPKGLLTDVRVGEYNGLQLAIFFRSLSPDGTLLVVSGHDDVVIRQEARQINAGFLVKPLDMNGLISFFGRNVIPAN